MWLIITSVTTVGYGDVTPQSNLGRLLTIMSCFAGNFIFQIITLVLTKKLQLNYEEESVIRYFQEQDDKKRLQVLAANLLTRFGTYTLKIRKIKERRKVKSLSIDDFVELMMLKCQMVDDAARFKDYRKLYTLDKRDEFKPIIYDIQKMRGLKVYELQKKFNNKLETEAFDSLSMVSSNLIESINKANEMIINQERIMEMDFTCTNEQMRAASLILKQIALTN